MEEAGGFLAADQGFENSVLHKRERGSNECHVKLKSLVAFLLQRLPRDQRGAESTRGRKKMEGF